MNMLLGYVRGENKEEGGRDDIQHPQLLSHSVLVQGEGPTPRPTPVGPMTGVSV